MIEIIDYDGYNTVIQIQIATRGREKTALFYWRIKQFNKIQDRTGCESLLVIIH